MFHFSVTTGMMPHQRVQWCQNWYSKVATKEKTFYDLITGITSGISIVISSQLFLHAQKIRIMV